MTYEIHHFVNGKIVEGTSGRFNPVFNPSLGKQVGKVALASRAELEDIISQSVKAAESWGKTSVVKRARVAQNMVQLMYRDHDKLAEALSNEHGKVFTDAHGEVQRGIDAIEFAQGMPHLQKGEYSDDVAGGIDLHSMRKPLGVVGVITPFNFPIMIPCWAANAIICGNAMILKPSEKDPSVTMLFAALWKEAGLPDGVLNVVNGDKEAVDTLCTDPRIKAVSFVGSTPIAKHVYATATAHGKRCQSMGGAKNHMVVMPDADLDQTVDALIGAAYGSAGERCMAISVAVVVGDETANKLVDMLKPKVENLKILNSLDLAAEMGPLVTAEHRDRVSGYIDLAEKEGSTIVVDGRTFKQNIEGYEDGYFLGGTLIDNVTSEMQSYKDEIFGPTLQIIRVNSFEEAIALANDHEYGNGTSIFTRDGDTAREYSNRVEVGMVGVNVPIPVPLSFYSFGGWKNSAFGDHNQYGMEGVRFYTKVKTVTSRWPTGIRAGAEFAIPTLNN